MTARRRFSRRGALASLGNAALGAAALTAAPMLGGCAKRRSPDTLRVAFYPPTLAPMYRSIAEGFAARHPGAKVEFLPATSYGALMQRDFRLALVDDEPDVSHIGLNHIRFYAERGLALPLDALVTEASEGALTAHPSIGRANGQTFALPFAVSVPVSYFNPALLGRAGIDAEALRTAGWDELVAMARMVARLPGKTGLYFDYAIESAFGWQMLLLGQGGRLMRADERRIAFDGSAGLAAARLLVAIGKAGQPDYARETARLAFSAGQLGCYQNTSANVARFEANAAGFAPIYAPLPTVPGGRLPAAGNAAAIVTRDPARQRLAADYLRFACGPAGQTIMARASGYLSLCRAAIDDPVRLAPLLDDPAVRALYDALPKLDAWYAFPGPRSEQVSDLIRDQMRALLLGRTSPEAALETMQDGATRLLRLA